MPIEERKFTDLVPMLEAVVEWLVRAPECAQVISADHPPMIGMVAMYHTWDLPDPDRSVPNEEHCFYATVPLSAIWLAPKPWQDAFKNHEGRMRALKACIMESKRRRNAYRPTCWERLLEA